MLVRGRYFHKQCDSIPKVLYPRPGLRHESVAANPNKKPKPRKDRVVIPPRIERGPTDILKALSSTVGYDPTAFHYKYPDDPYFRCNSFFMKKTLALSLESGRRSAKWIIEKYPFLFQRRISDPHIKVFRPKLKSKKEKTEETVEDLVGAIEERNVPEAIRLYEALKSRDCEIPKSTKQRLLELVCFYNCEPAPELVVEAKWFGLDKGDEEFERTWKKNGFAEQLFMEMDSECPLANSAIILGKIKYGDALSANEDFDKARSANMKLPVEVYNWFIRRHYFDTSAQAPTFKITLKEMSEKGIKPNLETLNAVLFNLCWPKYYRFRKVHAEELMQEFESLNIKPSLGTYGLLFKIYGKGVTQREYDYVSSKQVIFDIISRIENVEFEIQNHDDFAFFMTAMNVACEDFEDPDMASRIANMYFVNNNSKFVIRDMNLHVIFKSLCSIFLKKMPFDTALKVYQRYATKLFTPDVQSVSNLLEAINVNYTPEHLPEVWKLLFDISFDRHRVALARFLNLVNTFSDEESMKVFHKAAILAVEKIEADNIIYTEENTFSNMLLTFVKVNDEERISQLLQKIKSISTITLNEPSVNATYEYAVSKNNIPLILDCVTFAAAFDNIFASDLAKKALPLLSGQDEIFASKFIISHEEKKKNNKEEE